MKKYAEEQKNSQPENQPHAATTPVAKPRPPLAPYVLTAAQLAAITPEEFRRRNAGRRRPVWRHWYDPSARPPVAQTVEEALARAAKAKPGTVPEVEMLTSEELQQRMEMIRARHKADSTASTTTSGKR